MHHDGLRPLSRPRVHSFEIHLISFSFILLVFLYKDFKAISRLPRCSAASWVNGCGASLAMKKGRAAKQCKMRMAQGCSVATLLNCADNSGAKTLGAGRSEVLWAWRAGV